MIAKLFTLLMVLGAVCAKHGDHEDDRPLAGVDPNTLSCDPAGQVFLLLPHFTECDKFYMCTHGKEVEFECHGGLIFDFELQTCNWAWATQCWLRSAAQEVEVEGSGEESGDFEWNVEEHPVNVPDVLTQLTGLVRERRAAVAVAKPQFNAILDCSNARDAARMVPNKLDCQRYWRCVDGFPVSAYCSDGLFFNAQTQQCDFEGNAKCALEAADELNGEFMVYQ